MVQILINAQNAFLTRLNRLIQESALACLDTAVLIVARLMANVIQNVVLQLHALVRLSTTVSNALRMLTKVMIPSEYVKVTGAVHPAKTTLVNVDMHVNTAKQ